LFTAASGTCIAVNTAKLHQKQTKNFGKINVLETWKDFARMCAQLDALAGGFLSFGNAGQETFPNLSNAFGISSNRQAMRDREAYFELQLTRVTEKFKFRKFSEPSIAQVDYQAKPKASSP